MQTENINNAEATPKVNPVLVAPKPMRFWSKNQPIPNFANIKLATQEFTSKMFEIEGSKTDSPGTRVISE